MMVMLNKDDCLVSLFSNFFIFKFMAKLVRKVKMSTCYFIYIQLFACSYINVSKYLKYNYFLTSVLNTTVYR